ncbi:MAG: hypothetical protein FJ088_08265 [Deltaproteobacteria bacterium]|nr:hypothetical protein [Deltaproteobacteria bacterium]
MGTEQIATVKISTQKIRALKDFLDKDINELVRERDERLKRWLDDFEANKNILQRAESLISRFEELLREPQKVPEPQVEKRAEEAQKQQTQPVPVLEPFAAETMPVEVVKQEIHSRPTVAIPALKEEHWGTREELLYKDILRLFEIGDTTGALISFERLFFVASRTVEFGDFLKLNEERLLNVYEEHFGTMNRIAFTDKTRKPAPLPAYENKIVDIVLMKVDGNRTIKEIIGAVRKNPVIVCAVLNHLQRTGYIDFAR